MNQSKTSVTHEPPADLLPITRYCWVGTCKHSMNCQTPVAMESNFKKIQCTIEILYQYNSRATPCNEGTKKDVSK